MKNLVILALVLQFAALSACRSAAAPEVEVTATPEIAVSPTPEVAISEIPEVAYCAPGPLMFLTFDELEEHVRIARSFASNWGYKYNSIAAIDHYYVPEWLPDSVELWNIYVNSSGILAAYELVTADSDNVEPSRHVQLSHAAFIRFDLFFGRQIDVNGFNLSNYTDDIWYKDINSDDMLKTIVEKEFWFALEEDCVRVVLPISLCGDDADPAEVVKMLTSLTQVEIPE